MIYTFIMLICIAAAAICVIQITRIGVLSRAIRAEIDDTAEKRMNIIANGGSWEDVKMVPYPDIAQCYKNLKWYKLWERPSTLVVFEKE